MLRNSWARQDDKWYYVDGSGLAVSGRRKIGDKWYYFDSDCVWKEN
jgi:glucan-binding YG repeat protein